MAKEPSLEEVWGEFYHSRNPDLVKLADGLAPHLSIREELATAQRSSDYRRATHVSNILKKYTGPKDELTNHEVASKALAEIRS